MKKHSIKQILDTLFDSVDDNTNKRFNCPFCNGINSLSISKLDRELKYHCFKASCTLRGRKKLTQSLGSLKSHRNGAFKSKSEFVVPDYWIVGIASEILAKELFRTNSMAGYEQGMFEVGFDPQENRMVYFIKRHGKIIGAVGRSLDGRSPKAIIYPASETPFIAGNGKIAVLVEDCASACAISQYSEYTGIALLGTNLKYEYIPMLAGYNKVIIALDYDARGKALKYKHILHNYCKSVTIWSLQQDIKDMSPQELDNIMLDITAI